MATTLLQLRKDAGYKSGREFAEKMGIPQSTYARYESQPDGIPLKAAWEIADALGCSIDMIVGREEIDVEAMRGDVQKFHDSLSEPNKALHDEFMAFLAMKEADARKRKREIEERRNEAALDLLETAFAAHLLETEGAIDPAFFSAEEMRSRFEGFLRKCVDDGKVKPTRNDGKEAVSGYMEDYDRRHATKAESVTYAFVDL